MVGCYTNRTIDYKDGHREEGQKLFTYPTYKQAKAEFDAECQKAQNTLGYARRKKTIETLHIDVSIVNVNYDDFDFTDEVRAFDYKEEQEL